MDVPAQDALPRKVFMSLRDFFDPDRRALAPLVLLPQVLNPVPAEERV
jgi:hypothetical protein